MTNEQGFFAEAWSKLRKDALSAVVDLGRYLRLWAGVFISHLVVLGMSAAGVEPMIISVVSFMERWVWIASFISFFLSVLVELFRASRKVLS
jgi:hypothetical protein